MNRPHLLIIMLILVTGCRNDGNSERRIPLAKAGNQTLFYDQVPAQVKELISGSDSTVVVQNYISKWAKKVLMFQKAEKNLSNELKTDIDNQLAVTREDLIIYEYQRQMILQKMDTTTSTEEIAGYYANHENNFILTSNIVKALFIKLPAETPDIYRIKLLSRSDKQKDMQELEALSYQFAEKFDDFNEGWITFDRLDLELRKGIGDQENFLKWNKYYEVTDSGSVYLVTINDYKLIGSTAPLEYVRDDIKRIIWNNRRIEFIKTLENGIYNDAVKENEFKTY